MITYNYKCASCGHTFEVQQDIQDDALTYCPDCQQPALRKVLQPSPFVINGKGNYGKGRP